MNLKDILSDKTFLTLIWPHILGCMSQGITAVILLLALWGSSNSWGSFLDLFQSEMGRIIKWSILLVILFNIGFLYINLVILRYHKLAPPIGSINSKSSLKEMSKTGDEKDRTNERFFKYVVPFIIFLVIVIDFLKAYYFVEGGRGEALRSALTFVLPFAVALVVAHFSRIVVEVAILFLRYTIQIMQR